MFASLFILTETPSPTPTQGNLREGLDPAMVSPGTLGFILTFVMVVACVFLIISMNRRLRRIRYRSLLAERQAAEAGDPEAIRALEELQQKWAPGSTGPGSDSKPDTPKASDGGPDDRPTDPTSGWRGR